MMVGDCSLPTGRVGGLLVALEDGLLLLEGVHLVSGDLQIVDELEGFRQRARPFHLLVAQLLVHLRRQWHLLAILGESLWVRIWPRHAVAANGTRGLESTTKVCKKFSALSSRLTRS